MKNITFGFVVFALFVALVAAAMYGFNKQEIVECNTWAEQAAQYPHYYITHWQAEQCTSHHVTINAPIQ